MDLFFISSRIPLEPPIIKVIHGFDINVLSKNTIAKKLYKKIGFEEYKIQMRKRINHK